MKKLQVGIPVGIGIIVSIIILVISLSPSQEIIEIKNNKEIISNENILPEIQEKLDEIEKNRLESQYTPRDREWLTSGPFQIDRSEYLIGEKIFMRLVGIQPDEKGEVLVMRPFNDTHHDTYIVIPFDGIKKDEFNVYLEPSLSIRKKICSIDDILGEWIIVFQGTQYENLNFKIINKILPGEENDYVSVC